MLETINFYRVDTKDQIQQLKNSRELTPSNNQFKGFFP